MSRTLATATSTPKTTRPTCPAGTVLGSVIMKNRKIITSGEVTTTRQKSTPHTGANAQFAVMQWPVAASRPSPAASAIQNAAASPRSFSRRVMRKPPTPITRVGRDHPDVQGRPPEVERLDARRGRRDEGNDKTDVRRVEDMRTAAADHVLGEQGEARHRREDVPGMEAPWVVGRRADDTEDEGDAAPVSMALAGQTNARVCRKVSATSRIPARQDRRENLRDADPEAEPDLPQDVDRDDDRGDVEARIADGGQDERIWLAANGQRPGGHRARPPRCARGASQPQMSRRCRSTFMTVRVG